MRDFTVQGMDTMNGETWEFREPNCMLFYLYNIFYCIVEKLSFIHKCRYGWPNHVKTSCIFVEVIFHSFVPEFLISTLKLMLAQQDYMEDERGEEIVVSNGWPTTTGQMVF